MKSILTSRRSHLLQTDGDPSPFGTETDRDAVFISEPIVNGAELYLEMRAAFNHPVFETLSFQVNLAWFLGPLLKNVRSGKTGYAWLIDARGRFLFHPQSTFIGQSAFEARQIRDPDISYHQIDTIQRENMLKGMEGAGIYESAWHRGITGKIQKLIAYTPVMVAAAPPQSWSVALVAPVFEIEDAIRKTHRWQGMLQGLVMLAVLSAGGIVIWFEMRWSRRLEGMVAARTRALARSEEKYRSLVESAEDFIFTVDASGRLISLNSFTAAFFGCGPEELVGRGIDNLFTLEAAGRQVKIIQTVFENGKSLRDEFELKMGNAEIWLSANFMPIRNEAGHMTAVLCIARDITDQKKLASLGTLAAGVAHEINNPLGVMLGFCDLLIRKKEPGTREYEDLKVIERQGLHCKQIVENLLSFARVGQEETTGIAPEHLDHIFEPFYTTKPEGEGTGLGLFVSYGIIHKFGGSITCESRTRDTSDKPRGTTFTVMLPISRKE